MSLSGSIPSHPSGNGRGVRRRPKHGGGSLGLGGFGEFLMDEQGQKWHSWMMLEGVGLFIVR